MSNETFEGFVPPTKNFFHMPNEWINISAQINNLAELKVVQYVLRHTWGYREYDGKPKPITTDEFMHGRKRNDGSRIDNGTGLSNKSVVEGLKNAIKHGYLTCQIDATDQGRISKSYALKMVEPQSEDDSPMKDLHTCVDSTQVFKGYTSDVKDLHTSYVESTHRSEKDTKERHSRKKERMPTVTKPETDSSLPSSTRSSSSVSSTSAEQDASHIANETTPNPIEHLATGNTSNTPNVRCTDKLDPLAIYDEQEKQQHRWWCQLGRIGKINLTNKGHWNTLSEHIRSFEDFKSLYEHTQVAIRDKPDKRVYPGNLVDHLDGWKQEREPLPEKTKPPTSKPYKSEAVTEYDAMVAAVQARIAAQAGARK